MCLHTMQKAYYYMRTWIYNSQTQSACQTHTTTGGGNKWTQSNVYADCAPLTPYSVPIMSKLPLPTCLLLLFESIFSEGCTWLPPQCLDQDQPCYNKPYLAATCVSLVQQTGHHSTSSVQQTGKHPTPGRCWGSYTISRTSYAQLPALNNYWDSGDTHC